MKATDWHDGIVAWGPRTEKTRALWLAAERNLVVNDHPANCPTCGGANDPDVIWERHQSNWAENARVIQVREARGGAARAAHYVGGYHLLVNGIPVRCASVAATFRNKRALYRGAGRQRENLQFEASIQAAE